MKYTQKKSKDMNILALFVFSNGSRPAVSGTKITCK